MTSQALRVSEMFYSIQGEGHYCGQPSVFLRLQGCNLTCGGTTTLSSKQCEENASWRCDSIDVWTQGEKMSFQEICDQWETNNWIKFLNKGAHLVITGGEPLLQSKALESFLLFYLNRYQVLPFIEIETNGTIEPTNLLKSYINQYNVALKLTNSGLKKENYFVQKAIQFFAKQNHTLFKFVVANQDDIEELENSYIQPFQLKNTAIMLMPAADNRQDLDVLEPQVIDWCKDRAWRYTTRLHIKIWNKKTGI